MRPNTSIILGIQQPDVGAATSQALNNAGAANALRSRANMGEFLRTNGGNVLSGDQNALRALSQLGPEGFQMAQGQQAHQLGQKQTQLSMDATRQRMRILDAQQAQAVADRASQLSAQERADAAQELETTIKMLSTTRDPQSWDAMAQNLNPGMVGRFGEREALLAQYMDVKDVIAMGQPAKPQSTLGKFYADQQAGHIPEDQAPPQSGTNVTVHNNGAAEPTVFDEAIDKAYATDYVEWKSGGGADAIKNLQQIGGVIDRLESGENLSGVDVAVQPDLMLAFMNPEALDSREAVEEVVQRNLRLILGAQFTNEEGKRLIARAYNPRLSEAENATRLRRLFKQMEIAAAQRQAMADYVDQNRTLVGYEGPRPSITDFEQAIGPDAGGEPQLSPEAQAVFDKYKN